MKPSSSFTPTLPKSLLFLGTPGSGKTTLALQFPKVFLLDCDDNMGGPVRHLTLSKKLPEFFYDTPLRLADGKPTPRDQQYRRAHDLLLEACNSPEVETIIVDSLTSLTEMAKAHILTENKKKLGDGVKSFDAKFEFGEWDAYAHVMKTLIFWLKSSGKRIIFTAHITVDKDELNKTDYEYISIPGQLKFIISGWFEEAWRFFIETTGAGPSAKATRKIRTVPEGRSTTLGLKTAAGLGGTIDANADEILKKLSA